jgi:hypothetical protein
MCSAEIIRNYQVYSPICTKCSQNDSQVARFCKAMRRADMRYGVNDVDKMLGANMVTKVFNIHGLRGKLRGKIKR